MIFFFISITGVAAQIQPPDWLRGQVLLLPPVAGRGIDGVATVLRSGSSEQVRIKQKNTFISNNRGRKNTVDTVEASGDFQQTTVFCQQRRRLV